MTTASFGKFDWPHQRRGWSLLGLPFFYSGFLIAGPLLMLLMISFNPDYQQGSGSWLVLDWQELSLAVYRIIFTEPIYFDLIGRSVKVTLMVTLVTIVLSYPVALFIAFYGGSRKNLWLFLITLPFWSSYLLRLMSWKIILGYQGLLNGALVGLGLLDQPSTHFLYNFNGLIITLSHSWMAVAVIPMFVSLNKIDPSLLEAAADLGDHAWHRFTRVILPLSLPGIEAAILVVLIPVVGDYATPKLIGGADGALITTMIQAQFGRSGNWPLGAALSITTFLVVSFMAVAAIFGLRLIVRSLKAV